MYVLSNMDVYIWYWPDTHLHYYTYSIEKSAETHTEPDNLVILSPWRQAFALASSSCKVGGFSMSVWRREVSNVV